MFLRMLQKVRSALTRNRQGDNTITLKGKFQVEHRDAHGRLLGVYDVHNDVTTPGKNMLFNVMFNGATASTTWYIGLVDSAGFSAFASGDTMSSHAGWTEISSQYSQSTRPTWGSGSASGGSITNSSPAQFDMTATKTVHGIFITDNNVKGGTSGNLWSTAAFASDVPVVNGDSLKITYTLSA